jgi:hypothetical protein
MMIVGYDHNILGHFTAITKEPIFFATEPMSRAAGLVTIPSATDLFTEVRRPSQPLGQSGK